MFQSSDHGISEFKIIIVIRDQYDWHVSAYNTYIKCGGKLEFGSWLQNSLSAKSADWLHIINKWLSVFGTESVIFLPLKHVSGTSLEKRFLECCKIENNVIEQVQLPQRQNISSTPTELEQIRLINLEHEWIKNGVINQSRKKLIENKLNEMRLDEETYPKMNSDIFSKFKEEIYSFYKESNTLLFEKFKLDGPNFAFLLERAQ